MPPSIHPVDLIDALRQKQLTPAIVFLTSRRACDEAMESFDHSQSFLSPARQQAIAKVLEQVISQYPSIGEHALIPTVQRIGVAAHHAGHLPSWKIAVEELMRAGCLDAVFATTTLAAGVDFPARTVVITQSSIRKSRDFTDLTIAEVQQIAGRAGRRGKDLVGFAIVTPSPYIDLGILTKGLTGQPEPINSQFVITYPMVLNLLKAHPLDQIQPILAKSFAQFELNQRAEVLEQKMVELSRGRGIVLRQYRSKGQKSPMITVLRPGGSITECPASTVTGVIDRVLDCAEAPVYPWCTSEGLDTLTHQLEELPTRLPHLPILIPKEDEPMPDSLAQTFSDFPCPACPSRSACQKDHAVALKLRQELQRTTKSIQALRTSLWRRFQERIDVLQRFGYLTLTAHLTDNGEWARLIRIDHSLLITELIRAEAFTGADPAILAGVMASIAHDDDRPGAFPRISTGLSSLLWQVRKLAELLSPYEDPPLLRADVAAITEQWIGDPSLTWIGLCKKTTMAEGDIYRLLARTLEYLSQLHTLKATHPALAETASRAIAVLRRGVLEELP